MVHQLSFQLPEIDRESTRKRVEDVLETARIYKQIGFVRRETMNTPVYEFRFHGQTNATSNPVGDVATWNVDQEERMRVLTERVEKAVSRLGIKEREIIEKRYLGDPDTTDYEVYNGHVGGRYTTMSERSYYRMKARVFYKLAFMLRLEVYKESEQTS